MSIDEIFSKMSEHMVKGMMVHEQLMNSYLYLGLKGYAACHEYHYLEETKGVLPLWCSPVQVCVLPVNNTYHLEYASEVYNKLKESGIRVELDEREEKLGYKLRESVIKKIPYTLILGQKEVDDKTISYRKYGTEETVTVTLDEYIDLLKRQIDNKEI